ncbi:MAG: chloride channel protein [Pirellulales bacterium]|nr:chloride channel protein [Pirellulales bacterium]
MRSLVKKLRTIFDLESSGRLILYSGFVGVVAGLGAAAFFWGLQRLQHLALGQWMGYWPPGAGSEPATHALQLPEQWWPVLLIPVLGGLVCGVLVYTFAPEAEGHGTDAMVKAFHGQRGSIRARVPLIKALASIVTIGTGGSAGREGPIAQIGAGFGSFLATKLKLSDWDRRVLMLAGGAGGIAAIFRAPLGGALFSVEVLYASTAIELSAIVPCVVSAVVAYSVFASIYGPGLAFSTPQNLGFGGPHELPFYLVFAVVCSLVGFAYVSFFYGLRDRVFRRLAIPNHFKPAIGGLMLALLIVVLPHIMGGGYGWIQLALDGNLTNGKMPELMAGQHGWIRSVLDRGVMGGGELTLVLLAVMVLAKILATSFTISSGGSGGVFAPSLFIGAMLGGTFGLACHMAFPEHAPAPEAFVLVGMGGFFAGVAKVPLTALLMVSEMCGSYTLLVPLMLVSMINVALLSQRWTLYEEQVSSLIDSPAHLGDFVVDVLEGMKVSQVYDPSQRPTLIRENLPLPAVLMVVADAEDAYFPVVDDADEMVGIFSLHDIRSTLVSNGAGGLVLASDLARSPVSTVTPEDNLHTVLRLCTQKQIAEIPVVDPDNPRRVLGMLSRGEVIAAYDRQMTALRSNKA